MVEESNSVCSDADDDEESAVNNAYSDFNKDYFERIFEHEKMLSDEARMEFYHGAVTEAVQAAAASKGDGKVVVIDVGTGTGVLAAWADKAGADHVFALDHSPRTLELAATLAEENECSNIEFMCGHSSQFVCPPDIAEKVDIIIHEQIGDILFDEYMVKTIVDLRERVLKKGGRIVPRAFQLFVDPVQIASKRHVSMMKDIKSHGLDFSCLQDMIDTEEDPGYLHFRSSDPSLIDRAPCGLGETSVWDVDLETITERDMSTEKTLQWTRRVRQPGRVDALCVHFGCKEGDRAIHSGPDDDRCVHWGFRLLRVPTLHVQGDDVLEMTLCTATSWEDLDGWKWTVRIRGDSAKRAGDCLEVLSMKELARLRRESEVKEHISKKARK